MKVVRNINDMYHLAYLRYVIWQRKKDSKLELKKIQSASHTNPLSLQQKKEISTGKEQAAGPGNGPIF